VKSSLSRINLEILSLPVIVHCNLCSLAVGFVVSDVVVLNVKDDGETVCHARLAAFFNIVRLGAVPEKGNEFYSLFGCHCNTIDRLLCKTVLIYPRI
jgi:hypothetical protein